MVSSSPVADFIWPATIGGATKMTPMPIKSRQYQESNARLGMGAGGIELNIFAYAESFHSDKQTLTINMEVVFRSGVDDCCTSLYVVKRFAAA